MRPQPSDLAARLTDAEVLREFPRPVLSALASHGRTIALARNSVAFMPGDPPGLYVVLRGRIAIVMRASTGDEIELFDRHPGEVFGEVSLLVDRQVAEARAMEAALVLRLDADAVNAALRDNQPATWALAKLVAQRLTAVEEQLGKVSFERVKERIRTTLERLATEGGIPDSRGFMIRDRLTHDELARMVGSGRVAVSRALKELQREGKVMRSGRRIIVRPDPPTGKRG